MAGRAVEEVALHRQDRLRPVEMQHRVHRPPECQHRPGPHRIAPVGLPAVPLHRWEALLQRGDLPGERGGGDGAGQQPQPIAAARAQDGQTVDQCLDQSIGAGRPAGGQHRTRAVGVVEVEDARLDDRVERALAGGMLRIAFQLDRSAHLVDGQHTVGIAAACDRRGEMAGDAGHQTGRHRHIRNCLVRRFSGPAARQSGQCEGGAHQLQQPAPANARLAKVRQTRELGAQHLQHRRLARQLLQAAPQRPAAPSGQPIPDPPGQLLPPLRHRWHTEQSDRVSGWM